MLILPKIVYCIEHEHGMATLSRGCKPRTETRSKGGPAEQFLKCGADDHLFWSGGGEGEGQIWLFSLSGCLELLDYWTFLESLLSGVMLINFNRLKSTFSCCAWLHTLDLPLEVCRSRYYTVGSCNPFILSSMSSQCVTDHIMRRCNSF